MSYISFDTVQCPILHEIMTDPVRIIHDVSKKEEQTIAPHVFERTALIVWKEGKICPICSRKVRKVIEAAEVLKKCKAYVAAHLEELDGRTLGQLKQAREQKFRARGDEIEESLPRFEMTPEAFLVNFSSYISETCFKLLPGGLSEFKKEANQRLNRAPLALSATQRRLCQDKIQALSQVRTTHLVEPKQKRCEQAKNALELLRISEEMYRVGRLVFPKETESYYGDILHLEGLKLCIEEFEYKLSRKHLGPKDHLFLFAKRCYRKGWKFLPSKHHILTGTLGIFFGQGIAGIFPPWKGNFSSAPVALIAGVVPRMVQIKFPDRTRAHSERARLAMFVFDLCCPFLISATVTFFTQADESI